MFGSMHRVRRNRRNTTKVDITYSQPVTQTEIYYHMYMQEVMKRRNLQTRLKDVAKFLREDKTIPYETRKKLARILR